MILGAMMAAIGGYVYVAEPVQLIPEMKLDQRPAMADVVPSEPSLPSIDHPAAQPSLGAPDPGIPKDAIQEADAAQILALAEEKVSEAKRLGWQSAPPRRGDRKIARAANERGLVALQNGQIPKR